MLNKEEQETVTREELRRSDEEQVSITRGELRRLKSVEDAFHSNKMTHFLYRLNSVEGKKGLHLEVVYMEHKDRELADSVFSLFRGAQWSVKGPLFFNGANPPKGRGVLIESGVAQQGTPELAESLRSFLSIGIVDKNNSRVSIGKEMKRTDARVTILAKK